MKQKQYQPLSVAEMATVLFAVDQGYLDDVPVARIALFEQELLQHLQTTHREFLDRINKTGDYNDEIIQTLHGILKAFKANQSWE
jgi:F-type H+-transporting ATPase subunit alpha